MAALVAFHLIFLGRQAKFKCVVCVHMVQTLRTFFPMALNSRVFHELMICTCAFSLPLPLFLWILYLFPFGCQQDSCNSLPVFVYLFWCYHPLVELTVLKAKTSLSVSTPVPTPYLLFAVSPATLGHYQWIGRLCEDIQNRTGRPKEALWSLELYHIFTRFFLLSRHGLYLCQLRRSIGVLFPDSPWHLAQ